MTISSAVPVLQVTFWPPELGTTYGGYTAVVYSAQVAPNGNIEVEGRRLRKDGNEHLTKYPRRDITINDRTLVRKLVTQARGLAEYYRISFGEEVIDGE